MTANHYQILGVDPGAEGAAIRSAYRALMRVYHPDRNDDPEAQSRAREITAAFAVLGDPEKRAAYDARTFGGIAIGEQRWFAPDRRAPAPMRRVGLACVAVALALSLTLAVQPQWPPRPMPGRVPASAPHPDSPRPAPAAERATAPEVADTAAERDSGAVQLVVPPAPASAPAALTQQPDERTRPAPLAQVAQPELREAPAPLPVIGEEAASVEPQPAAVASCAEGCTNDRRDKVERMARGFLKQSLDHADWKKQQLLLSARNRAATSRALCRTDDCVTDAYLHQIRDTTIIMQGRIPSP